MPWYQRHVQNISTSTHEKREIPEGIWHQCEKCKEVQTTTDFVQNQYVCLACKHHERIGSKEYFEFLFDEGSYEVLFANLRSRDFLNFVDTRPYAVRLEETRAKTGLEEATAVATGLIESQRIVIACMDFDFIGGSMGSVMGEKICQAINYAMEHRCPLLVISQTGGARMMESAISLMQMAKVSANLTRLAKARIPYFSLLTNPTTGGVSASFAMLGDINMGEPQALIGFAGPRVIKDTLRIKELPENFQTAEAQLEHGFLDFIVPRPQLKRKLAELLRYFPKL